MSEGRTCENNFSIDDELYVEPQSKMSFLPQNVGKMRNNFYCPLKSSVNPKTKYVILVIKTRKSKFLKKMITFALFIDLID